MQTIRTHIEQPLRRFPKRNIAAVFAAVICTALVQLNITSAAVTATPDQIGQFSSVQSWPLVAVHSSLESTGQVLMWDAFGDAPNSERLWDPASGAFTPVPIVNNLFCSGHVELADGKNVIFGGHIASNDGLKEINIFDPVTRIWSRGPDMAVGRWYPTATTLGDGRAFVMSGDNMILGRTGVPQPFVDTSNSLPEIYNATTNTVTALPSAQRFIPLYPFFFVMPDGRVFDAGPDTVNRALNVNTGTWTTIANSPIDGGSAVMYRAGKILKSGTWGDPGVDYPGDGRAAVIDLNAPTPAWREVAPMANTRQFHNLVMLPDGNVLAVGGATRGGGIDSSKAVLPLELWNPNTETWTTMASLATPRMYHSTSLLLPDGRVMVAGGGRKGGAIDYPSAEIYSPPYLFKGARPTITNAPGSASYGATFTIDTPNAAQIANVSLIRLPSMTHAFDENQRFQFLNFTQGTNKLTVTAPANGNVAPPGMYMVFVVDTNGVPSVGSFIKMQAAPSDTTPPTVSITAPANGANVTGTTNVTANAADDVAVGAVQFKVDGVNIGSPDTTAPYSVSWDSGTATNGAHTLTAVATDSSGNTTTSAGVNVTVNNVSGGGLVAAYSFDEGSGTTVSDLSGNNNNGTTANTTWTTSGKFGKALSFNGTNAWVTVPDANSLDLTNGMTLEAWVNPTALGTAWRSVIFKETTNNVIYSLYANRNTQVPNAQVNIGGEQNVNGTAQIPLNSWTHLAATYDGPANLLKIYVNGVQAGSIPMAGNIATSTGVLRIGGNGQFPEWFSGLIDEVRIYNRPLTAAEIQSDMTKSIGVPDTTPPAPPTGFATTGTTATSISTSWTASTDNVGVASYNMYDGATKVGTSPTTSFTFGGLGCGTSHNLAVEAVDTSGNVSATKATLTASTNACDTTPPTVSITAPVGGTTVSGSVAVNANAADNDSVAGVQFKLDGNNLQAEDTTSPYGILWDTTTIANGSHTLTAVARDASNNNTTSAAVTVTVNNVGPPPPTGLVAAYSFDAGAGTTTTDLSGNGNNGTIANATWTTTGKFGGALSFNGTNAWVTVPDSASLDITRMTLEAWVNPTTLGNAWRTVMMKEQTGGMVYTLYANRNGQKPNAQVSIGGEQNVDGTAQIPLNTWTHLAATFDGAALKLYVNGAQVGSTPLAGNIALSNGVLRIGGNNSFPEWFQGQIDEIRVYNKALTPAEIQADMNKSIGTPDTTPPSTPTNFAKTGSTATTISTSWTASTDNVAVASYNLYDGATQVGTATGTTYTFTGYTCGTSHNLAVEAVDTSGNVSAAKATLTASTGACDTTPPTVSITAPVGGTTVSGSVAVNANASDNDSVAGVQFKLDGANLQAEDTTSPYGVLWDTTTATNGSHTLTAVARDPSDNTTTSAAVTVTVNNVGPPPPTGLVAAYSFDEGSGTTVADLSGNGNNGTVANTNWTTTGKYGNALSFNGTNAWVTVPDSASLDITRMTLEAWVNPTALGSAWRTVIFKETSGNNTTYDLYANRNTQVPNAQVNIGGERNVNGTAQIPLNTWTHLAATYDGANLTLYVNGTQVGTLALTGNIVLSTGVLRIGGNTAFPEWFQGQIDEIRVYNKALTQAEIQTDMNKSVGIPDTTPPSAPTNFAKTSATATSISTSWTAATDNVAVASYNMYDGATKVGTSPTTSYTFTGLGCGTSHNLAVETVDTSGNVSATKATLTASTNACDTTPPTVSITAPVGGTTVSGSVAVNANAADNDSVAGVQFKLDGNNLQAEDTTSPYSVSWDTTTAANGSHTLTAVARDASNNTTTSAPVAVTVNNTGPPPPTGLVGGWGFDEGTGTTTADASGNNNNGTLSGGPTWAPGKFGTAVSFDGVNDLVTVPDSASLDVTRVTMEAWVNPSALGGVWRPAVFKAQSGDMVYDLYASTSANVPNAGVSIGGEKATNGSAALPLNTWSHLAATYDGTTLRLYVNATQVGSLAVTGNIAVSSGALTIGGNTVFGEWFKGLIDEVRVYNKALTQAEIQADMTRRVAADTTAPVIASKTPAPNVIDVPVTSAVKVGFNEAMDPTTITTSTIQLRDASNNLVSATASYDPNTGTATLTPSGGLAYGAVYTATVKGGTGGVKDSSSNPLAADATWSFTTEPPPPPILVVGSTANPFSNYTSEILRGEGLNEFSTLDVSFLNPTVLNFYDVVVLGDVTLNAAQVTALTNWVNAGGNLIALSPDKQLAGLLGLTDAASTLAEGYLLVNTASGPGAGIVGQTIQFHGTADRYTLNGATSIATLYSNATTATSNPAVTLRDVGANGGQAAAFTFDLAKSIVYTRQGNPAWAGQDRDGIAPIRSNDLFFGGASTDWVNTAKIGIPQGDEQQRLLANMITLMARDRKPIPRLWYLPFGKKAALVMSGDDHAVGGTAGRFDAYKAKSPPGCVVANWECVRSTSYIYPASPLTNAQAASYTADGFEVALHLLTGQPCSTANWTPGSIDSDLTNQLAQFAAKYTSVPAPVTNRTHCVAWSDWATEPKVELAHGIRLDTNYYHYPGSWIGNTPGYMNGTAEIMRFADLDGTTIDEFQAETHMTDESGQTYPFTADSLFDKATGPEGYYGVYTANMHTDNVASPESDATIASAQTRGIPIVSAKQMYTWVDGRDRSSMVDFSYTGNTLRFSLRVGSGANGLQVMIPTQSGSGTLQSITRNGGNVSFTTQVIKGVSYAFASGVAGDYAAVYG